MFNKLAAAGLLACASLPIWAQQSTVRYVVQPGDSLSQIVLRYLLPSVPWRQLTSLNRLPDPNLIFPGQNLIIPRDWVRTSLSEARVSQLRCDAPITMRQRPLALGMVVQENDVLSIPRGCSVSLALEDGSVMSVPSGGELVLQRLRSNPLEPTPEVRMMIRGGQVDVSVNEAITRTTPFEVSTPRIVMGVRGTAFRLGHEGTSERTQIEVLEGRVSSSTSRRSNIAAGRGLAFGSTGRTEVDERLLPPPSIEVAALSQREWQLLLTPPRSAAHMLVRESDSATFAHNGPLQRVESSEFWAYGPQTGTVFYEWTSVSPNGIQGLPGRVGLCAKSTAGCNVAFTSPLASPADQQLELRSLDGQFAQIVNVRPDTFHLTPTVVLTGLPAGDYRWRFVLINREADEPSRIQQSGEFTLIAIQADLSPP